MVDRTKEGCGDVSDNGVDEALQGFVLIRKIEREIITKACAGGMAGSTVCRASEHSPALGERQ